MITTETIEERENECGTDFYQHNKNIIFFWFSFSSNLKK